MVSAMHRAIKEYNMLGEGDKVAVGVSGGKDSLTLLLCLAQYRKQVKFDFQIVAIAVDVCHAITPDNSKDAFESGEGVVVTVGPNIHPKLVKRLFKTADEYNIKTDIEAEGGPTGTDAWSIQTVRSGVATALLSIPLKYMHTNVETLSLKDVKATSDLLTAFIQNLDDNTEGWLCF